MFSCNFALIQLNRRNVLYYTSLHRILNLLESVPEWSTEDISEDNPGTFDAEGAFVPVKVCCLIYGKKLENLGRKHLNSSKSL